MRAGLECIDGLQLALVPISESTDGPSTSMQAQWRHYPASVVSRVRGRCAAPIDLRTEARRSDVSHDAG